MSKVAIFFIISATALPIIFFLMFSKDPEPAVADQQRAKPIVIPIATSSKPNAQQCAVCSQITDPEPKALCLQDFDCN